MPAMRILEALVNPGKNAQWLQGAKEVKEVVESEGGNISFYQLLAGGNPATVFAVSVFEDMAGLCEFGDKINDSGKLVEWMQRQAQSEGFPFTSPVEVNVFQDIHDEVGEPSGMIENPQIMVAFRQRLVPGRRPDFIAMAKAVRDALKSEGKSVGNSMQCVVGDVGIVTRGLGFASMSDWGARQQAGLSDNVTGILQAAQADGPIFESVESRMVRNITSSL